MSEKREEVLVGRSNRRIILRLVQGVVASGVGVWKLSSDGWIPSGEQDRVLLVSLAWVLAIGGLWLVVWSLQMMRRARAPVLRFDRNALTVELPPIGALPWSAIASTRAQRIRSRQYLHITLADPGLVAAIHSRVRGAIVENELWFDVSDLDLSADELAALIEQGRRGQGFDDLHGTRTLFG